MPHYNVVYGLRNAKAFGSTSFESASVTEALSHVAQDHPSEPVELWSDGRYLGRLKLAEGNGQSFWELV